MRERIQAARLVLLWILISGFAATAGPFGTFEVLGLPARLIYWATIVGLAISLTLLQKRFLRRHGKALRLASQIPYGLVLAIFAHGMNIVIFPEWGGWADFGFLALVTLSAVLMVEAAIFLGRHVFHLGTAQRLPETDLRTKDLGPEGSQSDHQSAEVLFQRRLPVEKRGRLVRLEAQDHYLLVVTDQGQETLWLRISDAEAELDGVGLRVHRSHWVSRQSILRSVRDKGRDFLQLSDGSKVPISRSYKDSVQAAGLL